MSYTTTTSLPTPIGNIPCTIGITLDLANANEEGKHIVRAAMHKIMPRLVSELKRVMGHLEVPEPDRKPMCILEGKHANDGLHIVIHDKVQNERTMAALQWGCTLRDAVNRVSGPTGFLPHEPVSAVSRGKEIDIFATVDDLVRMCAIKIVPLLTVR